MASETALPRYIPDPDDLLVLPGTASFYFPVKILFLSTWFPYPLDTGARIRVYHLLKALTRRHQVDLATFMPDPKAEVFLPELRAWCHRVEVVRRDPFWRDPKKAITAHFSIQPRDVMACYSPEMAAVVNRLSQGTRYDVVISSTTIVAPYALQVRNTPRILEEHNFMTAWMEERYQSQTSLPKRIAGWITWQKCLRYERWLYAQFRLCTMVSRKDQCGVEKAFPFCAGRVDLIPNGVDVERNHPGITQPVSNSLVFNGALSYYANMDAMGFFLADIFPRILLEQPDVQLKITGRTDGLDLSQLRGNDHVIFTGFLEDVRPTIAGSCACVVPLHVGGGTRLKILEAMALGTPVVSTSKGAEGIDACPEENILIADDPEMFASQTLRLLRDPELRARLARNGRALVEAKYSWVDISESFCQVVEAVADERNQSLAEVLHAA